MKEHKRIALIPAYEPDQTLAVLTEELKRGGFEAIVVNDGSSEGCGGVFDEIGSRAAVLSHGKNKGKGSALKTGLRYIQENFEPPYTVVTVDADGQHKVSDALRVCAEAEANPDSLVLGSRRFAGRVPLRSRLGNTITRGVYRLSTGASVYDTQTGLRAFSDELLPELLSVGGERYEYEMNVLMDFSRKKLPIRETRIETVYIGNNASSHFDAVRDSWRIYREILKFSASSLCGFAVDYALFCVLNAATDRIIFSNIAARLVSAAVNYALNRRMVFDSRASVKKTAAQYVLLAAAILLCNTALLTVLVELGVSGWLAKPVVEIALFFGSWFAQSRWIFGKENVRYEKA